MGETVLSISTRKEEVKTGTLVHSCSCHDTFHYTFLIIISKINTQFIGLERSVDLIPGSFVALQVYMYNVSYMFSFICFISSKASINIIYQVSTHHPDNIDNESYYHT